jgi:tetratricopeptide (TPR) repeat protein
VQRREQENLLWRRKLQQAARKKLHEHSQIARAVAGQILRRHSLCQRRKAPLPMACRAFRTLRWTKQDRLLWLLLGLLVCTPFANAQSFGFDRQPAEIERTVIAKGANHTVGGVIVSIRSLTGGGFASILTDSNGHFQVRGLDAGKYEIVVEEPGYEPTQETLELQGPSPPLEIYLKPSRPSPSHGRDYAAVSVRELKIPGKARDAFEHGLARLAKNDAAGSRVQFVRATVAFPGYYEAYYHLGVAQLRLGRDEEAAQAFQKAIDLSGGHFAWAQFAMGVLLCRRGKNSEAETVIRRGLDIDGSSAPGHLFLGIALLRLNRLEEAEKNAREALLRNPGLASAYLVLADVHASRGEYAMQLHDFDAYLKLEPDGPASKVVRGFRETARGIALRTKDRE